MSVCFYIETFQGCILQMIILNQFEATHGIEWVFVLTLTILNQRQFPVSLSFTNIYVKEQELLDTHVRQQIRTPSGKLAGFDLPRLPRLRQNCAQYFLILS